MIFEKLTRRDLVKAAVAMSAVTFLAADQPASADVPPLTPQDSALSPTAPAIKDEGDTLIQAVPINVGYALSASQAAEVDLQLRGYPGAFAAVRGYHIADDVAPAVAPSLPASLPRKGRRN